VILVVHRGATAHGIEGETSMALSDLLIRSLPARKGPRPRTTPINPHSQLDQNAPVDLQNVLWERMRALPHVETGPTRISVSGARAVHLPADRGAGPALAFMVEREFAHIHPASDGSLHLTLPDDIRTDAVAKGWAEPHPLVPKGRVPATVVMVYGPRDAEELETVWSLVVASHDFAIGRTVP
jgi:hypothetical protein